ncbi:MAG: hypothetical protein QOH84_3154 [Kribbellaceae bacterium]|nr:hypothetical protein [Kribbellaceae bacterium]
MPLKADLHRYLRAAREAVLWKLDGLSEYDVRRPLTPTGTNLLGLVNHLAGVELLYFGIVFDRPIADPPSWLRQDAEPNSDLWVPAGQSRGSVIDLYHRAAEHSDATIAALELELDATGYVPWWSPELAKAPLHRVLIHVIAESHRHAGHADLTRELIDGVVGLQHPNDFLPTRDASWWTTYRERVELNAKEATR